MNTITTTTFTISGMTCSHCVKAVTAEICKLDGVSGIHIDLTAGLANIDSSQQIDPAAVSAAVDEAGYEVVS